MPYTLHEIHDEPATEDFRSLKGKSAHIEKGLFIAESPKIVRKVLESGFDVPSAFMTEEHFENLRQLFENRTDSTNIFLASKPEMEKIIGYPLHQGVMLAVRIPENPSLTQAAMKWKQPFLLIALDGIADAENMGAIIRNAAAFGANTVIVDDKSCSPYLRRSVRVSMGTIVDIEIIRVSDLAVALSEMRRLWPVTIIGAALHKDSKDLNDINATGARIMVFGSEGWGLRQSVIEQCDILARIPIAPDIDSLNVAIASGIFLYALSQKVTPL
jgi:tRNA G18 (ribose-2'-O)-methylase SpoU